MGRQLTRGGYRAIDLCLFAGMLLVFEWLIITASTRWFPGEPWTVSVVPAVTAIVMVRWGPWAMLHAALGGLLNALFLGGTPRQLLIYTVGSLGAMAALPLVRRWGDDALRRDAVKAWGFALAVLLGIQAGRAALSLVMGAGPAAAAGFVTTDVITDLFTLVVIWIVRRLDGILENQDHYLRRVQAEQEKEEGGVR